MIVEMVDNCFAVSFNIENVYTFIPSYQHKRFILDCENGTSYFDIANYTCETISSESEIVIYYIDDNLNIQKLITNYIIVTQEYYIVLINDTETIIENIIMIQEMMKNGNTN